MAKAKRKKPAASKKPRTFKVRLDSGDHKLTFDQAFSIGHTLVKGKHYQKALQLFKVLDKAWPNDQRVKVMLARCQAGLEHYEACKQLLESAFDDSDSSPVEELQAAFVYRRLGMIDAAIRELIGLVKEHSDLPTACLALGDMFAAAGKPDKAAICWEVAIKRDTRNGPVAKAAYKQLRELKKKQKT
jgi:tetratricopeptide (TPR) repeat protein